ncbi:MAG: hypothetical protein PHN93_08175 [Sphaerochaetaceae bacterium]|nr:hypothetical protein [Sphaerochaetaceae bacterium]
MKKKVMLLSCVLIFVLLVPAFAASDPFSTFPEALGVQVGRLAGIGLSYQKWNGDDGYQVAVGAMYHPLMNDGHDILNYNIGFEYMRSMYSDDFAKWLSGRLYIFAGINHRGYKETVVNPVSYDYEAGDFHLEFGAGGGIGVEAVFFEHFAIATEMAYVLYYSPLELALQDRFILDLIPQVSVRYRFN